MLTGELLHVNLPSFWQITWKFIKHINPPSGDRQSSARRRGQRRHEEVLHRGARIRQKKLSRNKSVTDLTDTLNICPPMDATKAWLKNSNATDTLEFGGVKGCLSTMEIRRNGRAVTLTSKEFKTLAYLIKNPRRVISRDELLNEVWGYENYPCTRTVDNHILKLRKKLESEPAHPRHIHTVHCSGYTFLP
jgi:DNA-binding response OmpR family regulator